MLYLFLFVALLSSGCAQTVEVAKTIWGSSTRALEKARDNAITKTYDKSYWECVRAALNAAHKQSFEVFKKDEIKGYVVLMGIHGAVNTTEVGVFFEEVTEHQVRIEISSLSTTAKRIVAKALFHGMDIEFGLVPPDKPEPSDKEKEDSKHD